MISAALRGLVASESGVRVANLIHGGRMSMPGVGTEQERPLAQGATMEISVSRQDLLRELTATQSVVERKTTMHFRQSRLELIK